MMWIIETFISTKHHSSSFSCFPVQLFREIICCSVFIKIPAFFFFLVPHYRRRFYTVQYQITRNKIFPYSVSGIKSDQTVRLCRGASTRHPFNPPHQYILSNLCIFCSMCACRSQIILCVSVCVSQGGRDR